MSAIGGLARLGVALAALSAFVADASACSCVTPPGNVKSNDEINAWKFQKADVVARGKILSMRAGHDVRIGEEKTRYVSANFRITSVLKGNVRVGDAELVTFFGLGDCGLAAGFLSLIARDSIVDLELRTNQAMPGQYYVDMCGYADVLRQSSLEKSSEK